MIEERGGGGSVRSVGIRKAQSEFVLPDAYKDGDHGAKAIGFKQLEALGAALGKLQARLKGKTERGASAEETGPDSDAGSDLRASGSDGREGVSGSQVAEGGIGS